MAFEQKNDTLIYTETQTLATAQTVVEARILPKPGGVITRVLSIGDECTLSGVEVFNGEVRYTGRVSYKVLFVDVNGDNHCATYNADFSDKIDAAAVTPTTAVDLSCSVLDTDIVSVTGGELKLASVVEITLNALINKEFTSPALPDGVYTTTAEACYSRLKVKETGRIELTNKLSDPKFTSLMCAESCVRVREASVGVDSVTVSGEVVTTVLGETEDGLMASYRVVTDYCEELKADSARPDDVVSVIAAVTTTADYELNGGSSSVNLILEVKFDYAVYENSTSGFITDVFSVTNELDFKSEDLSLQCVKQPTYFSERIDGSVTLSDDLPVVDNVLAATAFKLNVTNVVPGEGEALVEGVVEGNVIYYSAEAATKSGVNASLPFSLRVPAPTLTARDVLTAYGVVTEVHTKIRRGNEIDIKADIAAVIRATSEAEISAVTEVELGAGIARPTAAVSVHIATPNQSLWEIAKTLGATPELIMEQNPSLTQPLIGGERIIVYRHLSE